MTTPPPPSGDNGPTGGPAPSIRLPALATAAAVAMIYISYPSSLYNGDGTVFSLWVEQAVYGGKLGELWHPRHLLYEPVGYLVAKVLVLAGVHYRSVFVLQMLNVAFAAATLYLYQIFCFALTRDRAVSILTSLLLAFSFAFWFFAIEAEVYLMTTFFWLLIVYTSWRWSEPGSTISWPLRAGGLGLMGAVGLLSHLIAGLVLLVPGWATLWRFRSRPEDPLITRGRRGFFPALLMSVLVFAVSGWFYHVGYTKNPLAQGQDFLPWVTGSYNAATGFGYDESYWDLSIRSLKPWIVSGSHLLLAGGSYQTTRGPLLTVMWAVVLAGAIAAVAIYLVQVKALWTEAGRAHVYLLLGFVPLAFFSIIYAPYTIEIKGVILPCGWLLAALGLARLRRRLPARAATAVAGAVVLTAGLLFIHNLTGSIRDASDPQNNRDLQRALAIAHHTEPDARVYIIGGNDSFFSGKFYLPYFANRQARVVSWLIARGPGPFPQPLLASLAGDRGHPVYVTSDLIQPGPGLEELARLRHVPAADVIRLWQRFHPAPVFQIDNELGLYRLDLGAD